MLFDGTSNSYVDLGETNIGGGDVSVSFWVRYDSFENSWSRIIDFGNKSSKSNFIIGHQGVTRRLAIHAYTEDGHKYLELRA